MDPIIRKNYIHYKKEKERDLSKKNLYICIQIFLILFYNLDTSIYL